MDNNEHQGIYCFEQSSTDVTIFIAEGASFSACGNSLDIYVDTSSNFTVAMEGDDTGTCVVGSTVGTDLTLALPPLCGRTCPDLDRFF